jgi:hypothetical protein
MPPLISNDIVRTLQRLQKLGLLTGELFPEPEAPLAEEGAVAQTIESDTQKAISKALGRLKTSAATRGNLRSGAFQKGKARVISDITSSSRDALARLRLGSAQQRYGSQLRNRESNLQGIGQIIGQKL